MTDRFSRGTRPLGSTMTREVVIDRVTGKFASFITGAAADEHAYYLNTGVVVPADYVWIEERTTNA